MRRRLCRVVCIGSLLVGTDTFQDEYHYRDNYPVLKHAKVPACKICASNFISEAPPAGSAVVRIDPLRFLAGCCKR